MAGDLNNLELISISDENLIKQFKDYEKSYTIICSRYARLIAKKVNGMCNHQADRDDLLQEGYIGLLKAFETYDGTKSVKFSSYADVCITNQITTAKTKNKQSQATEFFDFENSNESINSSTPESIILEKEKVEEILKEISEILSEKEWLIFRLFLTGCTYSQISVQLSVPQKVVDNALQRVRRKLKSVWIADS